MSKYFRDERIKDALVSQSELELHTVVWDEMDQRRLSDSRPPHWCSIACFKMPIRNETRACWSGVCTVRSIAGSSIELG